MKQNTGLRFSHHYPIHKFACINLYYELLGITIKSGHNTNELDKVAIDSLSLLKSYRLVIFKKLWQSHAAKEKTKTIRQRSTTTFVVWIRDVPGCSNSSCGSHIAADRYKRCWGSGYGATPSNQGDRSRRTKECTYKDFTNGKPDNFNGSGGVITLMQWFERTEAVFEVCACPEAIKVKYGAFTFTGRALT